MSDYFFETYPETGIPFNSSEESKEREMYSFEAIEDACEQKEIENQELEKREKDGEA